LLFRSMYWLCIDCNSKYDNAMPFDTPLLNLLCKKLVPQLL
jgi:hypothetical protein